MRVGELVAALGSLAPFEKAAAWDPVGLQIGDGDASVGRVLVCHEVTSGVLDAVESLGADTVVSYHPLMLRATTRVVAGSDAGGRAYRLASRGVALIVVHTNFDAVIGANELAEILGLHHVQPFGRVETPAGYKVVTFVPPAAADDVAEAMSQAGAGVIGDYTDCSFRIEGTGTFYAGAGTSPVVGERDALNRVGETRLEMVSPAGRLSTVLAALFAVHPYEEPAVDVYQTEGRVSFAGRVGSLDRTVALNQFAEVVGSVLEAGHVKVAGSGPVRRIAVVPGSGSDFIAEADAAGADVLVTGDVSHHRATAAVDAGMAIVDPGHVPTERPGMAALYDMVDELVEEVRLIPATEVWQR